ncbi:malate dehydrogenase, NAD-dependent [Coniosporium apollinis CBS 100218]|uniref:malate dehydrogenase n=1 Tax=Coniosporium apollinis (strain CBS 100218) TaxID=1168221 RepID=R7YIT3_CONA1|nr:malate dehydrogenase, NAD-dependent [Coniosporium apollinis CBS 100218]EON61832.1 malate dehydrogenase, NAD-dependent [Coniosporium apollinis CBS 100218]
MVKVSVLGASGQIGQPLSLLLKSSPLVTELRLYDVVHSVGVATDLDHIDTPAKVSGYLPNDNGLEKALSGAELVMIPAGVARKPGMTRDDLFTTNANVIADLLSEVAQLCPEAFICIITNPVNSTVPIAVEVLKKHGVFNPRRVFGVTTLDVVRASTFTAHALGELDPQKFKIPVVGGHSGATIIPLISQSQPPVQLTKEQLDAVTYRVQFGGDEIVKSKAGAGSATTCMAYAGFRFAQAIMKAYRGETGIVEPTYVFLPGVPGGEEISKSLGVSFFAVPVEFGTDGATKAQPVGPLSDYEQDLLKKAIQELRGNIVKGESHVKGGKL